MILPRVIPCLLLKGGGGLVKTVRFAKPRYVGDPINAVRIFNDKQADELVLLDITATRERRPPEFRLLQDVANEAFMPIAYGGGLRRLEDIARVLQIGMEKVVLGTEAVENPALLRQAATRFGSQSVVACLDVRRKFLGRAEVVVESGTRPTGKDPVTCARVAADHGAGEIVVNAIDRDGTMTGYDLDLIREVSAAVTVPVVALGGAGGLEHFRQAVRAGASAVAAGSIFVFHGKHRAVLISYPERKALDAALRG